MYSGVLLTLDLVKTPKESVKRVSQLAKDSFGELRLSLLRTTGVSDNNTKLYIFFLFSIKFPNTLWRFLNKN